MTLTNFPNGATSFGIPLVPGIPVPYSGNYIWVQEPSGLSTAATAGGSGTLESPYTRLDTAVEAARSGYNDVIMMLGTMHLDATLSWNKDKLHLVGVCAPLTRGKRARIIDGTPATGSYFTPMVSVTGEGCHFYNFGTFYGTASSSALVCWSDGGDRNCYDNVEFLGFGADEIAGATGARALVISKASGNKGEHTFRNCVFGVDTIARTAANYTVEIAGNSPRNYFYNCEFESYLTGSGSNACHLLIGSAGMDRYLKFYECVFSAETLSGGSSAMTQAFNVSGSAGGYVFCKDCWFQGVTNVETAASTVVYMANYVGDTADQGLTVVNAPS